MSSFYSIFFVIFYIKSDEGIWDTSSISAKFPESPKYHEAKLSGILGDKGYFDDIKRGGRYHSCHPKVSAPRLISAKY